MTLEEVRALNPGHWVIPTDEEVTSRVAEVEAAEEARQAEEAAVAAKAERIAALEAELAELRGEPVAQG